MKKTMRFLAIALAAALGFSSLPVSAAEKAPDVSKSSAAESVRQRMEKGIGLPKAFGRQNGNLSAEEVVFQCEMEEWISLYILNVVRLQNGLQPLSMSTELEAAAGTRVRELATVMEHTRPNGTSCFSVLDEYGISCDIAGENIAGGYSTEIEVFDAWWNSQDHQDNMMNENFSHVGMGYYYQGNSTYGNYWEQLFVGNCNPTSISVYGAEGYVFLLPTDKIIDDLDLAVRVECEHGVSYMPLIEEMCSGFDASRKDEPQTVTVGYGGAETTFTVCSCDPLPFDDVEWEAWYYPYVANVYYGGIMEGLNGSHFGSEDVLSRGQFATVLWKMEDQPPMDYRPDFPDVPEGGVFYTQPVMWASSLGVVTGYTDGKYKGCFGPKDKITREQMATMMYRYARTSGFNVSARDNLAGFPDRGNVSEFAKEAIPWAVAEGLITGDGGKINPQGVVNRAVCATIISRYLDFVYRQSK